MMGFFFIDMIFYFAQKRNMRNKREKRSNTLAFEFGFEARSKPNVELNQR